MEEKEEEMREEVKDMEFRIGSKEKELEKALQRPVRRADLIANALGERKIHLLGGLLAPRAGFRWFPDGQGRTLCSTKKIDCTSGRNRQTRRRMGLQNEMLLQVLKGCAIRLAG